MIRLPDAFTQRMQEQLGAEAPAFFDALDSPSPTSIRLHPSRGKFGFTLGDQVPWCPYGYYLSTRPAFYLDPHWHGGAYYVQEASSMFLDHVIRQLPKDGQSKIWLDLCAAPGGKTGILASHLQPDDVLLANEVVSSRRSILWENLTKAGYRNTFISGEAMKAFQQPFADIVLVDAPCAGEGMMRKEPEAIHQWSDALVNSCSTLQKEIVNHAAQSLKPGGYLIYSTCSYSPEENIKNVRHFIAEHQLRSVAISFPETWGIQTVEASQAIGYQLYPHRLAGEGLFVALLKNEAADVSGYKKPKKPIQKFEVIPDWLAQHIQRPEKMAVRKDSAYHELIRAEAIEKANALLMHIPNATAIQRSGIVKGSNFIPDHSLASSNCASADYKRLEVDTEVALDYLERSSNTLPSVTKKGWYIVEYQDTPMGWAKWIGQMWKNHYPMHWRLRNRNKS